MLKILNRKAVGLLIVLALLSACAGMEQRTPDERARITLAQAQSQLEIWFTNGKNYVAMNPQHRAVWKTQIVPAFDIANRGLREIMELERSGRITPEEVNARISPLLNQVSVYLIQIGVIK